MAKQGPLAEVMWALATACQEGNTRQTDTLQAGWGRAEWTESEQGRGVSVSVMVQMKKVFFKNWTHGMRLETCVRFLHPVTWHFERTRKNLHCPTVEENTEMFPKTQSGVQKQLKYECCIRFYNRRFSRYAMQER